MGPFALLFLGMVIVVGGILALRLHAFLALIVAAFTVALLTPKENVLQNEYTAAAVRITGIEDGMIETKKRKGQSVFPGRTQIVRKGEGGGWSILGPAMLGEKTEDGRHMLSSDLEVQAGDHILHDTMVIGASKTSGSLFAGRVASGFGNTCMKIGILIAMASVIGFCLTKSGAAERIVHALCSLVGVKRAPLGFVGSGFLLGIPVFFDTVFYLMMPLGKALCRRKGGKDYLLIVVSIVVGGTMAHSLVPPTPGPLLVAEELGVGLATAVGGGLVVGLFTITAGYLFAVWANRRSEIPLRATEGELEDVPTEDEIAARVATLPGLFVSLLPILLPVLFLAGATVADTFLKDTTFYPILKTLGDKNVALTLGALVGLLLLRTSQPSRGLEIGPLMGKAVASAGVIILITAAGGAFGHVLRQTNIAAATQELLPGATGLGLLVIGFLLCTLIRTAQGSATVAMITAVGIVGPIAGAVELPYHPVYLAIAIGCGSKPIAWMNDSGFWVISKMSGFTEAEMLRTITPMGIIMATVGLIVCLLGAVVLPGV